MKDAVAIKASLAPWARLRAAVKTPERTLAGYAGAFTRQPTRTLLSTMMLSTAAPQHAMVRTDSDASTMSFRSFTRVCSVWSKDGDDDFDVEASLKVLREHATRVKQMTPPPKRDIFGYAKPRSFEGPGGSFRTERSQLRQPIWTGEAGGGGRPISALVFRAPPEAGLGTDSFGKGSFRSIVRMSIIKKCFSKDAEDRAREGEGVRLKAQKAIARSFQAQNFLESPKALNSFSGAPDLLFPPEERARSVSRLISPALSAALTRRSSSTMGDLHFPSQEVLHPPRDARPRRALISASAPDLQRVKSSALHPDAIPTASLASANSRFLQFREI
ncbi:hypothetical protein T484DRAFT_1970667 [Baffinella frigidus]|nr:hypothetical protein T484DRAFT_1970667 [Cryptophyta sp. CCMP2293]